MTTKTEHSVIHRLIDKWIAKDNKTNAIWEIKTSQNDPESILVSGTLTVNTGNQTQLIKETCITNDNEDSIGAALQAINDSLLKILHK